MNNPKDYELNYTEIEGNRTNAALYSAYLKIAELSDGEEYNFDKMKSDEINEVVSSVFLDMGIDTSILFFDSTLEGEQFEALLEPALKKALQQLNMMRGEEGSHLLADIQNRIENIQNLTKTVQESAKTNVRAVFDKMVQNVEDLIGSKKIDPTRLEQEIALISDKVDITEECVRMESHLKLFRETIAKTGEAGKKLTFSQNLRMGWRGLKHGAKKGVKWTAYAPGAVKESGASAYGRFAERFGFQKPGIVESRNEQQINEMINSLVTFEDSISIDSVPPADIFSYCFMYLSMLRLFSITLSTLVFTSLPSFSTRFHTGAMEPSILWRLAAMFRYSASAFFSSVTADL